MSETESAPEPSGVSAPQIPGIPSVEQTAMFDSVSLQRALREEQSLTRNATPDQLQQDANFQEHGRNQRFRHHFEKIAIAALWVAAIAITAVGAVWLWHMGAPEKWRWLKSDDVSHLQSIMTAGLLVGVIGNHFKKRMG